MAEPIDFSILNDLDSLMPQIPQLAASVPESRQHDSRARNAHSKAKKFQDMIEALKGPHEESKRGFKRKVSEVASAPPEEKKNAAEELLTIVIEQRQKLQSMQNASKQSLLQQFQCGLLNESEFYCHLRNVQHKQRKLMAGDVTIERNRDRILRNIQGLIGQEKTDEERASSRVARMFMNILVHKAVDREPERKMFRTDLIGHYECQPEGWKKDIWCPVYQGWFSHKKMKAAHIVPYKLGYETMGDLFGEEGRGHELMWSLGNGLMLHADIEEGFDSQIFYLLPIERPGQPDGWKLVIINEEARYEKVNAVQTWDVLDGRELKFLNDQRPGRRFLYFHYWLCVYKALSEKSKGWQKLPGKTETGKVWATPGPYLRASMLRQLGEAIEDKVEIPDDFFDLGNLQGAEPLSAEQSRLEAKDLASALLGNKDFEASDSEEEDNS